MTVASRSFHLMTKPGGAACNLSCSYCFYLKKWDQKGVKGMAPEVLERYIAARFAAEPASEVGFAWQGGEPTLLGLPWFEDVVARQKRLCPPGRTFTNTIQTNGVLIDDAWAAFLARERFLVGLSLDGPREVHDARRVDRGGEGTFDRVMAARDRLEKAGVDFNILTVVGSHNVRHALKVYRFLRKNGSRFLQFIPLVERRRSDAHLDFAGPKEIDPAQAVAPESVQPEDWGRFLVTVFDEWVQSDIGNVYVRDFDNWLSIWAGQGSTLCTTAETCGDAMAIEADGSIYSCDHYVYPEYKVGSVVSDDLATIVDSAQQRKFGTDKRDTLPASCRACPWLAQCGGGCPKHRFLVDPADTEGRGIDHLCAGWKIFFAHATPAFERMAALLGENRAPAELMRDRATLAKLGIR